MSLWIKIVIGIIVFIALLVALIFFLTAGLTRSADGFFQAVAQKDMAKARSFLAEEFRNRVDEHELEGFLASRSIAGFRSANWSGRSVENGRGVLTGSIITDTGGVVPISLDLIKERGSWKIYAIRRQEAGLLQEAPPVAVQPPPGEVIYHLVRTSMHDFAVSVQLRDMSHFHSTLSSRWQRQTTAEELGKQFEGFYGMGDQLLALSAGEPQPTASPQVSDTGAMRIEGYYPAGSKRVLFEHTYEQDAGDWKLIGFSVEIIDAPAASASTGAP